MKTMLLPVIIGFQMTAFASEAYEPDELKVLRNQYSNAAGKALDPINKKYLEKLGDLKKKYALSGNDSYVVLVDSEMDRITGGPASEVTAVGDKEKGVGNMGTEFRHLVGIWEKSGGRSEIFEFKAPKELVHTYSYQSTGESKVTTVKKLEAKTNRDHIILENKTQSRSSYDSSSNYRYEIKIPFSLESLEVTQVSEYSGETRQVTFFLKRSNPNN